MAKTEKKPLQRSEKSKEIQASHPVRPLSPFDEMDRMFDRWFESSFPRGWLRPFRSQWPSWGEFAAPFEARMPKVDVINRDEDVLVRAEVPGIAKDDLDVSVSDNAVTIRGQTRHEEQEEKGDYHRCEISRGSFARTIPLPDYVDTAGTKARFENGVLELTLPKREKAKRRTIKID